MTLLPPPNSRPTMKDVAALSGTSLKTVSRVINNEPGVSEALVERVLTAARTLRYQPNLTASSLRRSDRKTRTIGLLLENVANPFSSQLHRAVEEVARDRDVVVFAGSLDEDFGREQELAMAFVARQVDGLIIVPTSGDQSYLGDITKSGTPVVFADRRPHFFQADYVVTANEEGAHTAVRHLIDYGHRHIAYLGDLSTIETAQERYAGYVAALNDVEVVPDPRWIRHDLRTSDDATLAVRELLDSPHPPSAIFASQNLLTIGTLRALRQLQRQHEVALVGFDDLPLSDLIEPGVTRMIQDVVGIGGTAAELLFARLDGDSGPARSVVLPGKLIVDGSGEMKGPFA